jgi:hypothetical protein
VSGDWWKDDPDELQAIERVKRRGRRAAIVVLIAVSGLIATLSVYLVRESSRRVRIEIICAQGMHQAYAFSTKCVPD